jgi:hypothetical protein
MIRSCRLRAPFGRSWLDAAAFSIFTMARRAVPMIEQSRIRWRVILVRIFRIPGVQRSIVKTCVLPA